MTVSDYVPKNWDLPPDLWRYVSERYDVDIIKEWATTGQGKTLAGRLDRRVR